MSHLSGCTVKCFRYQYKPIIRSVWRQKSPLTLTQIIPHKICTAGQFQSLHWCINRSNFELSLRNKRLLSSGQQFLCSVKENPSPTEDQTEEPTTEKVAEENVIEKELKEKIESLSTDLLEFKGGYEFRGASLDSLHPLDILPCIGTPKLDCVLEDKYQRSLADRENLRTRLEKQIAEAKLYGIQSFCKDLLEVSDVFRKAIESVPEEKTKDGDPFLVGLYNGVVMTENQLLSVFRRHGLERIIPVEGDKFDPSVQEAMFEVPRTDGTTPGTVAHIIRTGWKLHDRCVRSAQVGVFKEG